MPSMQKNPEAVESVIKYGYDNIQYFEFNTKSDFCNKCGYEGEMKLDEDMNWYCPSCGCKDKAFLTVTRRTCGYLGENFWNLGKTHEINERVRHL